MRPLPRAALFVAAPTVAAAAVVPAAPGFAVECPADAYGHEAATWVNTPPVCPAGSKVILIADPCPAAYMNEAANSWILMGEAQGSLDPYGACS